MKNEVALRMEANTLREFLHQDHIMGPLSEALPKWLSVDRLMRVVFSQVVKNPKILESSKESILQCVMGCAQLGLEPILGRAYLIPYYNSRKRGFECQLQVGYQGLVDLARRSGKVKDVYAQVVYANDEFEIEYGTSRYLKHKPTIIGEPGEAIGAYAVWELEDGIKSFDFMPMHEIAKRRDASQSYRWAETGDPKKGGGKQDSVWHQWKEEMIRKTVIKHSVKLMPVSIEILTAVELDNQESTPIRVSGVRAADKLAELENLPPDDTVTVPPQGVESEIETDDHMRKMDEVEARRLDDGGENAPPPKTGYECQEPGCTFIANTPRGLKSHMTRSHKPKDATPQTTEPDFGGDDQTTAESKTTAPTDPMFDCIHQDLWADEKVNEIVKWVAADEFLTRLWAQHIKQHPIENLTRMEQVETFLKERQEKQGNSLNDAPTGMPKR